MGARLIGRVDTKFNTKTLIFGKTAGLETQSTNLNMVNSLSSKCEIMYGNLSFNDVSRTFTYEKLNLKEMSRFIKYINQAITDFK